MNTNVKTKVIKEMNPKRILRKTREQIEKSNRSYRIKMADKYIKELIEPSLKDPIFKKNRYTKEVYYYR